MIARVIPDTYHIDRMSSRNGTWSWLSLHRMKRSHVSGPTSSRRAWDDRPGGATILATGWTPIPVFRELAARQMRGEISTPGCPIVQLDEYVGVEDSDRRSLFAWLDREFLTPLEVDASSVIRFRGTTDDPSGTAARYDAEVAAAGGLHLAVLGLGPNGHVGFNEPPPDQTRAPGSSHSRRSRSPATLATGTEPRCHSRG